MTDDPRSNERVTEGPLLDLHAQLVDAISRQNPTVTPIDAGGRRPQSRRSRSRLAQQILGAAAALVALVGATLLFTSNDDDSTAAADVTVQQNDNGSVTVSIENSVTVAEIEQALVAAGVDVSVEGMPTGPSRIDHFVGISGEAAALVGGDGKTTNQATFVKGNRVVLYLGVAADGGVYDAATDAWLRGEALDGPNLEGKPLSETLPEIERRAAAAGAAIEYRRQSDNQPTEPEPDDVTVDASGVAADKVFVIVDR